MEVTQQTILTENKRAHDEGASVHDQLASHIAKRSCREGYQRRVREILARYAVSLKGANILELGCGTGNWAQYFLQQEIGSYTGLDISEGMVNVARTKNTSSQAQFFCRPVEELNPEMAGRHHYDLIFSFSFIHHLYDLPAYFRRVRSLLAPGGLYLGMHEPFCRQIDSERRNMGEVLDNLLAILAGWDMPKKSFAARLGDINRTILARFHRKAAAAETDSPDVVDYQLSRPDFNHASVQDTGTKQGLDCHAILYSYYRFPLIRACFGSMKNYFAIAARPTQ